MKNALNLPTQITLARLALAIVFVVLLSTYDQRSPEYWKLDVATALFIVAAATDFLDGYLARKRGEVTPLGRVLDPFVDKVLVCGAFIFLAGREFVGIDGTNASGVQSWMVAVIVGRELLVTGIRSFSESIGHAFGASIVGKIKMWAQSIAVPVILFQLAHSTTWANATWANNIRITAVWSTVIITVSSCFHYLALSRAIFFGDDDH